MHAFQFHRSLLIQISKPSSAKWRALRSMTNNLVNLLTSRNSRRQDLQFLRKVCRIVKERTSDLWLHQGLKTIFMKVGLKPHNPLYNLSVPLLSSVTRMTKGETYGRYYKFVVNAEVHIKYWGASYRYHKISAWGTRSSNDQIVKQGSSGKVV